MENKEIARLIYKYIRKDLSPDESGILQDWVQASEKNRLFFERTVNAPLLLEELQQRYTLDQTIDEDQAWERLLAKDLPPEIANGRVIDRRWWQYAAAAALVIAIISIVYLLQNPSKQKGGTVATIQEPKFKNDVLPGTRHAVLTLDDGSTIILDSTQNGTLATQGNIRVVKLADGQIAYNSTSTKTPSSTTSIVYNTMSVPKGGDVIMVTLADGSKVWLNAASSVRYPVTFNGDVRKVEITGEAYFEVASSKGQKGKRPFIVAIPGMEVEVLGTHFNINSYDDEEAIKTTLLEGKVKVHSTVNGTQTILQPNEQAQIDRQTNNLKKNPDVDVDATVAWRLGLFQFNNSDLKTVMRQLSRWYDVDISYEGNIPKREFLGMIPRSMSLAQVLNLLQGQKIHFTIEGKKIIVSP